MIDHQTTRPDRRKQSNLVGSDPYMRGRLDFAKGIPIGEPPYEGKGPTAVDNRSLWRMGWEEARDELTSASRQTPSSPKDQAG